jgi:hypothetical protein
MSSSIKSYLFDVEDNTGPRAIITPQQQDSVIGAVVRMDGRASFDTAVNPSGFLNYHWSFVRVPIGSQVALEGFINLEADASIVSFAPDVTGFYEVQLIVDDGSIDSAPFVAGVDVSVIVVPNNKGIIPDGGFIWRYLSDFWSRVEQRQKFEVFWSAAMQIVAAELLKQYQYDYNKSIKDIQRFFQKRWVSYSSGLFFDRAEVTGFLAEDQAGTNASTSLLSVDSATPLETQPDFSNLVTVPLVEGNFVTTSFNRPVAVGRVINVNGRSYTMARSSNAVKAVNEGTDGFATVGTDNFSGSGFEATYVGFHLRILSGTYVGTYVIDTVVDSANIEVSTLAGDPVIFLSGATGISYSIVPSKDNVSNFFADLKEVPTVTAGQPWRFSSTLVSSEFDLEEQGVSPGDVLEVELTRTDLNLISKVRFQVVAVDRARLSFVLNTDDLEDGIPSNELSAQAQLEIANSLQVTGLFVDTTGNLQYTLEADLIKRTVTSKSFKRTYYETLLTPETEIDLGAFKIKARPLRVIRNSKIRVDAELISVPVLQEYIRQPDLGELDGVLQVIDRAGKMHPIDHRPYVLSENLDFIIDDEAQISGAASITQNVDQISIPRGDLIDRNVNPGDIVELTLGSTKQIFNVRKVLDPETLLVSPTPTETRSTVPFKLTRRVAGKFIRFTQSIFSKTNPTPDRLWAELTYFSNDPNIEANFGVLVGVRREDLLRRGVETPYKSVVEGLMYALVTGPTHENLRLAAQILLGLPFAVNAGVILEINPSFRIREDGSPLYGRILVEARDRNDRKLGITNIYIYPQGRQLEDPNNPGQWIPAAPNESGLAINPDTGIEYRVGDAVDKFAVLSKGVEIADYLSDTNLVDRLTQQGTLQALLTQYHSFQLRINSDITTPSDIDLTTEFIKRAKPHYVKISAGLLKIIEDIVEIEDALLFKRFFNFFDNPSFSVPQAIKFDQGNGEADFLSVDGIMYAMYVTGTDLDTTFGSDEVFSTVGGFIVPGTNQSFDSPYLRPGDLLSIEEGPNAGFYPIASVVSNNIVELSGSPAFQTQLDQIFRIYRPVKNPIFAALVTVSNASTAITFPQGGFSAGIAVGDTLTFYGGAINASHKYTISSFDRTLGQATVQPAILEAGGTYNGIVWREALVPKYFNSLVGDTPYTAGFTSGSASVVFTAGSSDLNQLSFIQPGDNIIRGTDTFTVLDFNPAALTAYVTPLPGFSAAGQAVKVWRPYRGETPISVDLIDRMPDELFILDLRIPAGQQDLTTTAASPNVGTVSGRNFNALGIRPGDYLVILAGADSSRNIGYGPGIFPILSLPSNTTLRLTRPLTANNPAPGIRYGIQRRKPL